MATNSITLIDGTTAYASDVEDKVNPLYTDIDYTNIAAGAGILFSQLDSATVASVATTQTISGIKTFSALTTFSAGVTITGDSTLGTNLFVVDDTNDRLYEGATSTTTIDSVDYQHQITVLASGSNAFAIISTATGATGIKEARYHNSSSPAVGDDFWTLSIYGNNSGAAIKEYTKIFTQPGNVTAGAEDSEFFIQLMTDGTLTTQFALYKDMAHIRNGGLAVGTNTITNPESNPVGLYVVQAHTGRRVALFQANDDGVNPAIFDIYKNSASPAASDSVVAIRFMGNDSAANYQQYALMSASIIDPTSGSEDGQIDFRTYSAGTSTTVLTLATTANGGVQTTQIVNITATASTSNILTVIGSSLTTGNLAYFYSNSSSSSSRNLVEIVNDNTSADNAVCLRIQQDGNTTSTHAVEIALNTNSVGIYTTNGSSSIAYRVVGSGLS